MAEMNGGYAMTSNRFLMAGAVLALLISTPAPAQNAAGTGNRPIDAALLKTDLEDLEEMDVYDAAGEEIGAVDEVVHQGDNYFIVVEIDQWFDLEDRDLVVPIEQFRLADDELTLPLTQDQAHTLAEYQENAYQDAPDDGTVESLFTKR